MAEQISTPHQHEVSDERLNQVVAEMRKVPEYYQAGNSKRLDKAVKLYREGGVSPGEHGLFQVKASDEADMYPIVTTCPCAYSQDRQDRFCAHRIAVALYRKLHSVAGEQSIDADEPADDDDDRSSPTATGEAMERGGWSEEIAHVQPHKAEEPMKEPSAPSQTVQTAEPSSASQRLQPRPPMPPDLPRRSIVAIVADLSRPLPAGCIAQIPATTNRDTGRTRPAQDFLHWHTVAAVLDTYAPGWEGRVVRITKIGSEGKERLGLVYRLTIHAAEGSFVQDGDGMEDEDKDDYGDAMTSATATGLKRAAAKFGVGRYLYDKDGKTAAFLASVRKEKEGALKELATVADAAGVTRKAILAQLCRQAGVVRASDIPTYMVRGITRQLEAYPKDGEHIDYETGEVLHTRGQGECE